MSLFHDVPVNPHQHPSSLQHNGRIAAQFLHAICRHWDIERALRIIYSCQLTLSIFNNTPELRNAVQKKLASILSKSCISSHYAPFWYQIPLLITAHCSNTVVLPKHVSLVQFCVWRGEYPFIKALPFPPVVENDGTLAGDTLYEAEDHPERCVVLLRAFERKKYLVVHNPHDSELEIVLYLEQLQSKEDFAAHQITPPPISH